MKRMVMVICILILMCDLSDDGHLGNTKFLAPHSPVKSLEVSSNHDASSAAPGCHNEPLGANFQLFSPQSRGQPPNPVVSHTRKIIVTSHLSAGGLPG
jgi:hypothetical protein